MSLERYVENGWLRRERTSPQEIADQLAIVVRSMNDAAVVTISDDLRFYTALNALLALANAALRATGYRVANQQGHHSRTIETLEFTIGVDSKLVYKLLAFSRNEPANYDSAGSVSNQELEQILKTADELRGRVEEWIELTHPELMRSTGR